MILIFDNDSDLLDKSITVYGVWGDHTMYIIISKLASILANTITSIVSSIVSSITHFINRLIQCRQNTVVSPTGSIQHCIFSKLAGFLEYLRAIISCSNGTTYAKKNVRNNHEYLTRIKKSGKNLQYSNMRITVVDLTCTRTSISSMTNNNVNTNNVWKRKLDKITTLRNYSTNKICYLLCAISLLSMPNFYLQKYFLQKSKSTINYAYLAGKVLYEN